MKYVGTTTHSPSQNTTRHHGCGPGGSSGRIPRSRLLHGIIPTSASRTNVIVAPFNADKIHGAIFGSVTSRGHSQLNRYALVAYRIKSGPSRPVLYKCTHPIPSTSNPRSSTSSCAHLLNCVM